MNTQQIRSSLMARGLNYRRIADILNMTPAAVASVARRSQTSHRIAIAIATALELPIEEVFPDVPSYHRPYLPPVTPTEAEANKRRLSNKLREMQLTGS